MNYDTINTIIKQYIDDAMELNKYKKSCHIALLIKGKNKVISHGFNQMDRGCFRGKSITSLHAEIDCLRKIRPFTRLCNKKYIFVVVKVSRYDKSFTNSRPCDCCTKYIKGVGINSIYCSTELGSIEKINMDDYTPCKICYKC